MPAPPLLRLVRWPGTLTAAADAAAVSAVFFCTLPATLSVTAAAALLYAGGVVLNDAADADRDRTLHPGRPIPSGAAGRGAALGFGFALLLAGVAASLPAGKAAAIGYGGVAAAILLYDFLLKRWGPAGVLGMGLCRGGSVLAAALSSPAFEERLLAVPGRALLVPLPWLLMGAAVTAASLLEESPRRRALLPAAAAGILLPVALAFPLLAAEGEPGVGLAIAPAAILTFALGRSLAAPGAPDGPAAAGAVVREGVFGFLLLDSAVLALFGLGTASVAALALWIALRLLLAGRRS